MPKLDEQTQYYLNILKALNQAIDEGPWDESAFFKAIGKKLEDARDKFKEGLNLEVVEKTGLPASIANRIAQRHGLKEVFILIYCSEGTNIGRWESTIENIRSHTVNRPVYAEEALAKASLRGALNKQNEAYIAAYVHEEDILKLPEDKMPHDRWDNELVPLNDHAIKSVNITRFIHISGRYEVENGKLIRTGVVDFL